MKCRHPANRTWQESAAELIWKMQKIETKVAHESRVRQIERDFNGFPGVDGQRYAVRSRMTVNVKFAFAESDQVILSRGLIFEQASN